ncbi:MAG: flavodoxin-dependent (E)-4-hydroxy-3-methylbut-2-enyl-diphosphate synthase [Vampirovibrionales bacterium]
MSCSSNLLAPLRRKTRQIRLGNVLIGGDAPVSVQSMLVNDTRDITTSINEIARLADAGCEIVRLAVPNNEAAQALESIVKASPIPVVADIHFDYRLALAAADAGVHGLRVNPGNIGDKANLKAVVAKAKQYGLPIRVGVNGGSVEKPIKEQYPDDLITQLVESAKLNVRLLEDEDFDQIKVSVKASDPMQAVAAYRRVSQVMDYPLHLGVTEAGTIKRGLVKSAVGLGILLSEGIGDTIRVSLTADSIEEVFAGHEILRSVGLRETGSNLVSCPACGRCAIDLHGITGQVEAMIAKYDRIYNRQNPLHIAVMGCFVNGPGECGRADLGISGGRGNYFVFRGEEKVAVIPTEAEALAFFEQELIKTYEGQQDFSASQAVVDANALVQELQDDEAANAEPTLVSARV